jgi:glyoxylase-like metal-dependent hydrolase (beta-lactamase superfamily II)/rhodanese-related sulfurtransferase
MAEGIEIGELLARADRGDALLLLDVRNEEEFGAWRLEARRPVETLHVPYFDFIEDPEGSIAKVPEGRDLVVLCAKGGSSEMVADLLVEAGRPARNVAGGMIAYGEHIQAVRVPARAVRVPAQAVRVSAPGAAVPAEAPTEIVQLNRRGKGCLSYLVRSGPDAVVVDPSRRIEAYAELARQEGCTIRFVLDTHVHADHLSGRRALAAHVEAADSVEPGGTIELDGGRLSIRALASPGHTPESMLYLVGGTHLPHLLSGDTLFVSGVGRPDLGGEVEAWGRELFRTLSERIAGLQDDVVVLPAHYGSITEIGPDGIVSGRLGDLRRAVPEMKIRDERSFVEAMRAAVREPPATYERIVRANRGLEAPSEQDQVEWELGKNRCAAEARGAT